MSMSMLLEKLHATPFLIGPVPDFMRPIIDAQAAAEDAARRAELMGPEPKPMTEEQWRDTIHEFKRRYRSPLSIPMHAARQVARSRYRPWIRGCFWKRPREEWDW